MLGSVTFRLLLSCGLVATLTAAAPAPVGTQGPGVWPARVVESTTSQFLTLPVGNEVLPSAVLTPTPFYESLADSPLNGLPQDFWQDLSVSLLALFGLVNTGLLILWWARRRSTREVVASIRQRIAPSDEGPARICRNPVPGLDSVIMSNDWPTMVSVGANHSNSAPRRARLSEEAELTPAATASYRFYAMNAWGVVDSGTGGRFESDSAAFAHARRIADDGRIEVWRNGSKLMTISANRPDEGFADNAQPVFA